MTLSKDFPPVHAPGSGRSNSKPALAESGHTRFVSLGQQAVGQQTVGQPLVGQPLVGQEPQPIRLPGTDCMIKPQVPLTSLTSFKVGGPAEMYVAPRRIEDLQASFEWAQTRGLPITLLGAGSNLLISDRGIPGLVVCTRYLRYSHFDAETGRMTAAAGEPIARLAWQAAEHGLSGLEWAVGIPGTLGGAVVMNAGAHGLCTADILVDTHTLAIDGTLEVWHPDQLNYTYRSSKLQAHTSLAAAEAIRLVTQATLQLQPGGDPEQLIADTTQHLDRRRITQPYHLPSCGSVFRNPGSHKAGWLIEQTGLKGHSIGGAQIAQRHANFILNCGGATANDIFQLIHHIQQTVEQNWSLCLEPEVKMIGEFHLA
ncbi:MAG: UDP-N-acetylmuramate dehydrogenase [Drouetiella hepatica Uher 2000/2452]|uniref:UDP-N-acetylenolpyruvoylglucosamine reductase n=1 Tax=Drouetiella hepatica Uher 2000/2452 TaxID=904376 RepID=A0A951Q9I7_9CYAN|nr:UDP-N-acetylmuramate dehydrogenase [Drouetiella hepatica Uher 2000/2452]